MGGYRGVAKTDGRDTFVIADQARIRRDRQQIPAADEAAVELKILTAHREDLSADRVRVVNRLRGQLLTGYRTPAALRPAVGAATPTAGRSECCPLRGR
ncbi:IS110 family transposase [Actinomadura rudentiformis]|uniref:IS110 family transposase n=1 Tax=Actinomadura rudentiformis TaxID=359158 RepID=UPI001CEF61D7